MMTVRFPNGQALQYNDAMNLAHGNNEEYILRKKKGGDAIAFIQASAGAIVEFVQPCRVYNPLNNSDNEKIEQLTKEIRLLKRKLKVK